MASLSEHMSRDTLQNVASHSLMDARVHTDGATSMRSLGGTDGRPPIWWATIECRSVVH